MNATERAYANDLFNAYDAGYDRALADQPDATGAFDPGTQTVDADLAAGWDDGQDFDSGSGW
jgi:hypothetical protein